MARSSEPRPSYSPARRQAGAIEAPFRTITIDATLTDAENASAWREPIVRTELELGRCA
jgi:hypothetical protein